MSTTPSSTLLATLRAELMRRPPFAQMAPEHVERFIAASQEAYYAPGDTLLEPAHGVVRHLVLLRRGRVVSRSGAAGAAGDFDYEAGDVFPVGAVVGARAVTATYRAHEDCFCLLLPVAELKALAAVSAPLADFLNRRVLHFLDLSRRALQVAFSSQTLAEQSLESPLGALPRRAPAGVPPQAPVSEALALMHERRIGSVLVLDGAGAPQGIVTRHDVIDRITLPQLPLDTPVARVMSAPVHSLGLAHTAQDAALLMSRRAIRHVPVTDAAGRAVSIVSERDLFALQRLSLKQVSTAIRAAPDVATLTIVAQDIRRFARNLLGQGVQARQLTELISHLNDVLTERLVTLLALEHGLAEAEFAWLAFGSEGRGEQTIATDQDNGIVFVSDDPPRDRPRWLAFGEAVNRALDACGYPLCKGNVMASNPQCCLGVREWCERFADWMEHGTPEDLLKASIYFDFRAIAGRAELAQPMRELVTREAARLPRFMHQMAMNALNNRPPLNFLGGIEGERVDLKMGGTAIFVDAARLYALAHGVAATGTRERLTRVAGPLGVPASEAEAWVGAFEYLQMLRLQAQMGEGEAARARPNDVELDRLNDIDRRVLKECLRIARRLQQRMELDYAR